MKFLCVCLGGNVRSVAMATQIHEGYRHEAIPVGWNRVSRETMTVFCQWADVVVIMEDHMREHIPREFAAKIRVADVGPDRYGMHVHPELKAQTKAFCADWKARGLL